MRHNLYSRFCVKVDLPTDGEKSDRILQKITNKSLFRADFIKVLSLRGREAKELS